MCACCSACAFNIWCNATDYNHNYLKLLICIKVMTLKLIKSYLISLICQAIELGFYLWHMFNHLQGSVIINVPTKHIIIQLAHGSRLLKIGCICPTITGLRSEETWQLSLPGKTSKQHFADGSSILPVSTTGESRKDRKDYRFHFYGNI